MGTNIHILAEDVWSFFQENKDRLAEEMVAIAENEETEYAVYLTEDNGYPLFSVCKGKLDPEFEEGAISEEDCADTAKRCYVRYLFPVMVNDERAIPGFSELDELTAQEMNDAVYEREDELQLALCDFLQVALMEGKDGTDVMDTYGVEMVNDILDYLLEYLGFELCLSIYRPMFITDEGTGEELYTEFPYDQDLPCECIDDERDEDSIK